MIYELAGNIGLNPGPYTMRELFWMNDGRNKSEWARTALIACLLANPNRDTKKHSKPFTPDEFNPYAPKRKESLQVVSASQAAALMFGTGVRK